MLKNKILVGVFIFVFAILGLSVNKAEAATCTAITGNWNTTGTWSCGHIPLSADDVVIPTSVTVTVDTAGAVANTVAINDPVNASNGITLASPGTLTVTGAVTWAGSTGSGNSTVTVADGMISAGGFNINSNFGAGNSRLTFSTGTVTTTAGVTFVTSNGSTDISNSGAGHFNLTGTISDDPDGFFTMNAGTLLTSTGTSAINLSPGTTTLGQLEVASGTLTLGAAPTITGLQIDSGATLAAGANLVTDTGTGAGTSGFTVNGTFSGTGGATLNGLNATIDGTGTITNNGTFTLTQDKSIAPAAVLSFPGTVSVPSNPIISNNGNLTFSTLTLGSGTIFANFANVTVTTSLAGNGRFNNANGANLTLGGTTTVSTLFAPLAGNTVTYNKAGDQTVKFAVYNNLVLSGSGEKSYSGTTIQNDLTINSGATANLSSTVNVSGGLNMGGVWEPAGSWGFTESGADNISTVFFSTGTGKVVSAITRNNSNAPIPVTMTTTGGGYIGGGNPVAPNPLNIVCPPGNIFDTTTGVKCEIWGGTPASLATSYDFGVVNLRNGSSGAAVMELQKFLNVKLNISLVIDGKFGPKTIAAVKEWQKAHGLVADGIVGPKTKIAMNAQLN